MVAHRLRRHPIAMTCHFEHSLVLTWAVPADELAPLVPLGLELDVYDGRWGFLAVAVVRARQLRPRGLPAWIGADHSLTGYRLFVRHRDRCGRVRRGLHILRSDTDRRSMQIGGNLLTRYRYDMAAITIDEHGGDLDVGIRTAGAVADLRVVAHLDRHPAPLPSTSPFASALDARRYAGPLPWTFDHEPETGSVVMVHGRRSSWHPQPTAVDIETCRYVEQARFAGHRFAGAFHVGGIDYSWDRGVRVGGGGRP